MKKNIKTIISAVLITVVLMTGYSFAMDNMSTDKSDKIGDMIHESVVDGYMLSYYFMDLRNQKSSDKMADDKKDSHGMDSMQMDKPHHLMVYIMDKDKNPVLKGKVGFVIKDGDGQSQKAMGMFMSNGFGTTADMKKKGDYSILTKAMIGDKVLKDNFSYTIN